MVDEDLVIDATELVLGSRKPTYTCFRFQLGILIQC